MGKLRLRLIAFLLVLCLLLSGCLPRLDDLLNTLTGQSAYTLENLEYTRPTQADLQIPLDACKALAAEGDSMDDLVDAIWVFYDAYDLYLTNCAIADLRYYADVTDSYWSEESTWCTNNSHLADAALEELYYALAKSPLLPSWKVKTILAMASLMLIRARPPVRIPGCWPSTSRRPLT